MLYYKEEKMKEFIKKFKKKRQFKKNMKHWIKLCKCKPMSKIIGLKKVGKLTHKYNIKGVGEIKTRNPIFISYE